MLNHNLTQDEQINKDKELRLKELGDKNENKTRNIKFIGSIISHLGKAKQILENDSNKVLLSILLS